MKRTLCLLIIVSLCSFTIEDPFSALLKKLEEFTKRYPTEKVHLHLDKSYYAAGDNIWFKAYIADARTSQPALESNILYVELISETDSISKQLRLPMENGISWGDFKLPDTLVEGNYRIRAYTQLMRNAGPDFFFDKAIKIGNKWNNRTFATTTFSTLKKEGTQQVTSSIVFTDSTGKAIAGRSVSYVVKHGSKNVKGRTRTNELGQAVILLPAEAKRGSIAASIDLGKGITSLKTIPILLESNAIDVQFLPEGGKMVQGFASRVAIKAIDANGKGIDVAGTITDDKGTEISTFQTTHLGMGSFYFNPIAGQTYVAKMKKIDGTDYSVALPKAEASGYLLNVNQSDTANVNIKVTLSAELVNKGELKLIAHRDGRVYLSTKVSTAKQVAKITIPNNKFPSGIVQLTLFSPQELPIAERLVFVNNVADKVDINLQQLKASYGKKEKVALELAENVKGSFSIAVTNADVVTPEEATESNIFTSLLLSSGLKGYIEKPNYYFINAGTQVREHLDNLLLTQGWRKLDWKNINDSPLTYPAEKSIRISGTITKDKKPLANSKISLISNKDGMFIIDTLSDKNGRFVFEGLEFPDSTKFIIQARSELGKKTVDIALDIVEDQRVTSASSYGDIQVNVNQSMQGYLKESAVYFEELSRQGLLSKTILLNEVKIEGKKTNPAKNSRNFNGAGVADQIFDGDDMINSPSVANFLHGKISGGSIINGRPMVTRYGPAVPFVVLIDGNIADQPFDLRDINPEGIESIEILMSFGKKAIYGKNSGPGMMLITTRQGAVKWAVVKYAPGVISYSPRGYYNAREFYSPMYDMAPSNKPDLRTTVFWAPNLQADETGKIKFDYFNTDQSGNYRIVIEGFDIDGKLARKIYTYKVN
ncbi:MAG: TonB-dependent receptor [Bacteroidota bacterium]